MTPSIATKFQYVSSPFLFFLTHYTFRPLRAILRWDIQLDVSKDYSYYNGSAVRTQLDICLYWYFDPWSPIHVIKLSIKVVKTLIFTVKLVSYIKCKNVKISRWMGVYILLWWSGRSSNLFILLVDRRRVDRAVAVQVLFFYACYCFVSSFWLVCCLCWRCECNFKNHLIRHSALTTMLLRVSFQSLLPITYP
jgi:hypothetical protein